MSGTFEEECATCGLTITTIKGIDRCGLRRVPRRGEACVFRDRGEDWDVALTPGEIARLDQYNAEMLAHPPVPINIVTLYKLLNRYTRLKQYRAQGFPPDFIKREQRLIEKALEELRAQVIEGNLMDDFEPRRLREEF